MNRVILLVLLIAGCAKAPSVPSNPPSTPMLAPASVEELYATLLDAKLSEIPKEKTLVVIRQSTHLCKPPLSLAFGCVPGAVAERSESELPLFGAEAIHEFKEANRESRMLPIRQKARITVVDDAEIRQMIENGWWEDPFRQKFPTAEGFVQFSAPGIAGTRTALVYVGYTCGGLCGSGSLVSLSRTSTGWVVLSQKKLWVS